MPKHAPDVMSASFFAQKVRLNSNRPAWILRHPIKTHPLKEINSLLVQYHSLAKAQLRSRHSLLDQIVRQANNYLRGKNTRSGSEKTQTVAILAWQANQRLMTEQRRAKELEREINATPQKGVKVVGGSGANMRFERVAKGGGVAVTGAQLYDAAEHGKLGAIELTGDDANDFYALKKLLKKLTPEQVRQAGLRPLEYAGDKDREQYATDIDTDAFTWQETGGPVHTLHHLSGEVMGMAHYACSLEGDFYVRMVAKSELGSFAHSSFLAGKNALCAGTIVFNNGRLLEVTNESGHYQPKAENLADACKVIMNAGYDPRDDGYALFTDFRGDWVPQARSGRYRVPLKLFADTAGNVPNHLDFEVQRMADGHHEYADPNAALARGAKQEANTLRKETTPSNCLKSNARCGGPQQLPNRFDGAFTCEDCRVYAQTARVQRMNTSRLRKIAELSLRPGSMANAHRRMADYAEQLIVDLLHESGIERVGGRYAFLSCGSLARHESVTFSDIDGVFVTENDNQADRSQGVFLNMQQLLQTSGLESAGFKLCQGGLSPADTLAGNPGLRGTPETLLEMIDTYIAENPGEASAHLLGAYHTKFVYGDRTLAQQYQQACVARRASGNEKPAALAEIRQCVQKIRSGPWKIPTAQDLAVNVKDQLYRPAHMILHALAQYYGVEATASREQATKLVSAGKMSRQVANLFVNILEDAGAIRTQLHLEQREEFELVLLRNVAATDPAGRDRDLANKVRVADAKRRNAILGSADRVKIILGLAEAFISVKARRRWKNRKSPFTSSTPAEYAV